MYPTLRIEREGAVDWVTLNRPDRLNAIDPQARRDLLDYFGGLAEDADVRIVVMRGAGRAFCAGLDLKERGDGGGGTADQLRSQRGFSEIVLRMRRCPQPIVALVKGPAAGLGFSIALAADVRIAGQSARMNAAFVRIGFSGGECGSSYHLPRLVGGTVARELLMTGRFIDAERMLRVGLVSEVVPDEQLDDAGRALVRDMLATAPLGLRLTKELVDAGAGGGSLEDAVALEDRSQVLCAASGDPAEGIRAFLEKRDPRWS